MTSATGVPVSACFNAKQSARPCTWMSSVPASCPKASQGRKNLAQNGLKNRGASGAIEMRSFAQTTGWKMVGCSNWQPDIQRCHILWVKSPLHRGARSSIVGSLPNISFRTRPSSTQNSANRSSHRGVDAITSKRPQSHVTMMGIRPVALAIALILLNAHPLA